jgi:hypothetical protein
VGSDPFDRRPIEPATASPGSATIPLPPPIPKPIVVAKAKTKTQRVDTEIVPQKEYTLEIKDDGTINFSTNTTTGAKQGLAEMKLCKKAVQLQKKNLAIKAKQVRQSYTQYTRRRGHMFRGGRTVGSIIRIFQAADRDGHARQLANAMAPLDREMNRLDRIILNLDNLMTQVSYKLQTMA